MRCTPRAREFRPRPRRDVLRRHRAAGARLGERNRPRVCSQTSLSGDARSRARLRSQLPRPAATSRRRTRRIRAARPTAPRTSRRRGSKRYRPASIASAATTLAASHSSGVRHLLEQSRRSVAERSKVGPEMTPAEMHEMRGQEAPPSPPSSACALVSRPKRARRRRRTRARGTAAAIAAGTTNGANVGHAE